MELLYTGCALRPGHRAAARFFFAGLVSALFANTAFASTTNFINFETAPVHPIALSFDAREIDSGSNPADPVSHPFRLLAVSRVDASVALTWQSVPGASYACALAGEPFKRCLEHGRHTLPRHQLDNHLHRFQTSLASLLLHTHGTAQPKSGAVTPLPEGGMQGTGARM